MTHHWCLRANNPHTCAPQEDENNLQLVTFASTYRYITPFQCRTIQRSHICKPCKARKSHEMFAMSKRGQPSWFVSLNRCHRSSTIFNQGAKLKMQYRNLNQTQSGTHTGHPREALTKHHGTRTGHAQDTHRHVGVVDNAGYDVVREAVESTGFHGAEVSLQRRVLVRTRVERGWRQRPDQASHLVYLPRRCMRVNMRTRFFPVFIVSIFAPISSRGLLGVFFVGQGASSIVAQVSGERGPGSCQPSRSHMGTVFAQRTFVQLIPLKIGPFNKTPHPHDPVPLTTNIPGFGRWN